MAAEDVGSADGGGAEVTPGPGGMASRRNGSVALCFVLCARASPRDSMGAMRTVVRVGLRWMAGSLAVIAVLTALVLRPVDQAPHSQAAYAARTRERLTALAAPGTGPEKATRGDPGTGFRAGFGRARLTPRLGGAVDDPARGEFTALPLAGYGNRRGLPATGTHDDLWAKAVAFASSGRTGVMVSLDALIVPREVAASALDGIRERLGLDGDQVYFGATHTHCGPGGWGEGVVAEAFAGGFRPGVREWMARRLVEAATAAVADLQRAALGRTAFEAPDLVRNRLLGDTGRKDATFDLLVVRQTNTGRTGVIGSFAAHATVISGGFMEFSAEYPGAWQRGLESNGVAHALFLAGAVGSHGPKAPASGLSGAMQMGARLAERSSAVLSGVGLDPSPEVDLVTLPVDLPPLQPRVAGNVAVRPWLAARLLPVGSTTRVQAWRLGGALYLSTPCDYSGELALDLRAAARSAGLDAVVTSFNGDYLGYVVPSRYYAMSGYETRTMSFFGPQLPDYLDELLRSLIERSAAPRP